MVYINELTLNMLHSVLRCIYRLSLCQDFSDTADAFHLISIAAHNMLKKKKKFVKGSNDMFGSNEGVKEKDIQAKYV